MKCTGALYFLFLLLWGQTVYAQTLEEGKQYLDSLISLETSLEDISIDSYDTLPNGFQKIYATEYYPCNGDLCNQQKYGLITPDSDTIPPILYEVNLLEDNTILINPPQAIIIIDEDLSVKKFYNEVSHFNSIWGIAVGKDHQGYLAIDKLGNEWLTDVYDYIESPDYWGRIAALVGDKWKILEAGQLTEKEEVDDEFEDFNSFNSWQPPSPKVIVAKHPSFKKYGLLNYNGTLNKPFIYDSIQPFLNENSNLEACKGGYCDLLDYNGHVLTNLKYTKIDYVGGGIMLVSIGDGRYGVIDVQGKELVPLEYSRILDKSFNEDHWVVKKIGAQWGILDAGGKALTEMIYEEIEYTQSSQLKGLLNGEWVSIPEKNK